MENADSLNTVETDHIAGSILARISKELGDKEWKELDIFNDGRRLAKIIDDYTPL
jgi:hypothetical protein